MPAPQFALPSVAYTLVRYEKFERSFVGLNARAVVIIAFRKVRFAINQIYGQVLGWTSRESRSPASHASYAMREHRVKIDDRVSSPRTNTIHRALPKRMTDFARLMSFPRRPEPGVFRPTSLRSGLRGNDDIQDMSVMQFRNAR